MGYGYKNRSRTGLRRRRRGRRYGRKFGRRRRAVQPFSIIRRLKCVGYTEFNAAAGAIPVHQFKLNSAQDPQGSASATDQGLGADQYEAIYRKYQVLGWKVKIEACTKDNTSPCIIGFTPMTSTTALTSYTHYKELPGTVTTMMTPDRDRIVLTTCGGVKRYLHTSRGDDDQLQAAVGADPARTLYGHLFTQAVNLAADIEAIDIVYTIEQIVKYFDPRIPSRSSQAVP